MKVWCKIWYAEIFLYISVRIGDNISCLTCMEQCKRNTVSPVKREMVSTLSFCYTQFGVEFVTTLSGERITLNMLIKYENTAIGS